MYARRKACSGRAGRPATSVKNHWPTTAKNTAIPQSSNHTRCGTVRKSRKKVVRRDRRRSSTTCRGTVGLGVGPADARGGGSVVGYVAVTSRRYAYVSAV